EDAPAALDFLCRAFGFERQAVFADDKDPSLIHHAQLVLGGGMIMLGSHRGGEIERLYGWKTPRQAGCVTQTIYVIIDDPDAHYARARAEGAEILIEPHDNEGYPGR